MTVRRAPWPLVLLLLAGCSAPGDPTSVTMVDDRGGGAILTRLRGVGPVTVVAGPGVDRIDLHQAGEAAPFEVAWSTPAGGAFRARVEAASGSVRVVLDGRELALDLARTDGVELRLDATGEVTLGPG